MARKLALIFQILSIGFLFVGCETAYDPGYADAPEASATASPATGNADADRFRMGDLVKVTFSGLVDPILPHEERIKDDGNITLSMIGSLKAVGKTPGELQKELYDLYVPKYFKASSGFNLTVQSMERVYYVGGEVRKSGPVLYIGETTVTKAIQAAGDFTDYAKKSKVTLTRADGTSIKVNCNKAIKDPRFDPPVFPGDKIYVPRRIL
jgi:polysaccharide biosynthesis/export protein VpsN